nr:MAG TPA: hypothetical protein [Caudoviricetes sp.]DAW08735.1 MAG TPA: hypothetical protein [Caudoviricetes sp.]
MLSAGFAALRSCIFARFQGGVFSFLALLADFSVYRLFPRIFRQTGRYRQ